MMRRTATGKQRTGCGLLVFAVALTCLLLVVNRLLARSLYDALVPAHFDFDRLRTIVQYLLMIGLLFPQWWIIDRVASAARGTRRNEQ